MSKHAEGHLRKNPGPPVEGRRRVSGVTAAVALAAGLLAAGCNVAIGGGVLVAGVVAGILTYDCAEGVGVTLWDRSTAHPICDATVVAEQEGKRTTFSPCYNAFLGEGTWTVSATKDGYQRAEGSVIIPHGHSCSQPTYHSVELTLLGNDEGATKTQLGPPSPAPTPPPVMEPPPGAPPQVGQPTPGAPPSGTATPPEAAPPPITGAPPGPAAPSPITGRPPPVAPAPPPSPSPAPSRQAVPPSAAFPLPGKAK